ncbi:unnamed protein product [Notodromas monacha]|uniref:C-type lectin domain-containing protein n=1 Tax=Notodromas monacha TaxID=399045 RepID=A0A7R9GEE3_9CRUS|nr:unnamed protein product [Notodromas monacha]CAG0919540.1 unnamed protein product [Notodromas monacha]
MFKFNLLIIAISCCVCNVFGKKQECPGADAQFEGTCYKVLPDQYDWMGGVAACANTTPGSTMLAIETEEENEFLKTWLAGAIAAISNGDYKYAWLYGSDLGENKNFLWHNSNGTGSHPFGFDAWGIDQPSSKPHYHCMDLNLEDNLFTWDSYPCTGFLNNSNGEPVAVEDFVVCEYPMPSLWE